MFKLCNPIRKSRLLVRFSATNLQPEAAFKSNAGGQNVFEENATKWWTGDEFKLLRSMNKLRVPFIVNNLGKPITEAKILDAGCGGGILSEQLARLGSQVTGIDPVFESINQAKLHANYEFGEDKQLSYKNCQVEDLSSQDEYIESFDAVVASEVLEHIHDVEGFLLNCTKVLKPNGNLFITTINQTPLAYFVAILVGEYIMKQPPIGTHQYKLLVNLKGLIVMLERLGYHIKSINGFMYEPISGSFRWTPSTHVHYAMHAVKMSSSAKGLNFEQKRFKPKTAKSGTITKPKTPLDRDEMMQIVMYDQFQKEIQLIVDEVSDIIVNKISVKSTPKTFENILLTWPGRRVPIPLHEIAQISMKGNDMIIFNLTGTPEAIKPAYQALLEMGHFNPQVEVNTIYIRLPQVTRELREELAKSVKKANMNAKNQLQTLSARYIAQANQSRVSKDLIRDAVDNIAYHIKVSQQKVEDLHKKKIDLLLNQTH